MQRRFTKRLQGLRELSYSERLNKLNISTLELRCIHNDLCMCFKILKGFTVDCLTNDFTFSNINTRGHSFKLVKEHSRINCRLFFFSNRVIDIWNSLHEDVVNCNTCHNFMFKVKKLDFGKFVIK